MLGEPLSNCEAAGIVVGGQVEVRQLLPSGAGPVEGVPANA